HHRHTHARQAQHVALRFFQNRYRQNRRARTEIKNSFRHCCLPYSSKRERKALPATLVTNERGKNRSASTVRKLVHPEMTVGFSRGNARNAVSTTSSGVCIVRIGGRSIPAASKKFVSVTPGHNAITWTPCTRFSSHNASENDSTNAFVAA